MQRQAERLATSQQADWQGVDLSLPTKQTTPEEAQAAPEWVINGRGKKRKEEEWNDMYQKLVDHKKMYDTATVALE